MLALDIEFLDEASKTHRRRPRHFYDHQARTVNSETMVRQMSPDRQMQAPDAIAHIHDGHLLLDEPLDRALESAGRWPRVVAESDRHVPALGMGTQCPQPVLVMRFCERWLEPT